MGLLVTARQQKGSNPSLSATLRFWEEPRRPNARLSVDMGTLSGNHKNTF